MSNHPFLLPIKDRLPHEFEILDAHTPCSLEKLGLFLDRARVFVDNKFTILNMEAFSGKHLEKVLSFLSDRRNETLGVHLHCIQRKSTILHTSTWVEGKNWDDDLLCGAQSHFPWRGHILTNTRIKRACVVVSDRCGAGKTRHIRQEIGLLRGENVQVGTITVHEGSTPDSLARATMAIFHEGGGEKAIHLSFMWLPSSNSNAAQRWIKSMNTFLFSLLVQLIVRDHAASKSINIGKAGLHLFVELPSDESRPGRPATEWALDWVRQHLPILALCGEFISPVHDFFIDDETRRVGTYLRAYENGTIDRKFRQQNANKRIIFVFDRSGSMGNGKLSTATDCALRIFDSHVQTNDVSFLMLN